MDSYRYRINLKFLPAQEALPAGHDGPAAVIEFGINFYCQSLHHAMRMGISWDLHKNAVPPSENAVVPRQEKHLYNTRATWSILREFPDRPAHQSSWIAYAWARVNNTEDPAYEAVVLSLFQPHDWMDETFIQWFACTDMSKGKCGEEVHPTGQEPGQSTNKSHAVTDGMGNTDSIVPKKLQEKLPESVERAVHNAIHNTGPKH